MFELNLSQNLSKYSKAFRCTFFGERKNPCSSKFVQLLLLNRVKARWSENCAAQGFHFINSFISSFFGPNSKTCTCEVRAAWGSVSRGLTVHTKYQYWFKYFYFLYFILYYKKTTQPMQNWYRLPQQKRYL